jgi:hypothetical protein
LRMMRARSGWPAPEGGIPVVLPASRKGGPAGCAPRQAVRLSDCLTGWYRERPEWRDGLGRATARTLQGSRKRRVEYQPPATQEHHRLEGVGVAEAVGPAHHQPNLVVVESFHHSVAQPSLGIGNDSLLVAADYLLAPALESWDPIARLGHGTGAAWREYQGGPMARIEGTDPCCRY